MKLEGLLEETVALNRRIKDLLVRSGFYETYGLDAVEYDRADMDHLYAMEHLERFLEKLKNAAVELDHVTGPVLYEGTLHRTPSGRYGIGDYDLSAGAHLEYICRDRRYGGAPCWRYSQIERRGEDYCLTAQRELPLEGLYVRIKGQAPGPAKGPEQTG